MAGATAYLLLEGGGLQTIDVSNPASPRLVGSTATRGPTVELAVADGLAYVTEFTQVEVLDVRDRSQPRVRGEYQRSGPGGSSGNVVASGNMVYIADAQAGLKILRARLFPYGFFLPLVPR